MKHKILSLSLAAALLGGVSVQAYATPTSSLQENKTKYTELNSKILDLNSKISDLNIQIENLNKKTEENNLKINETNQEIAQTQQKIDALKKEIEEKQKALGVRLSAIYKSQLDFNPVVFLLSSDSFSEFLSRLNAFSKIITLDDNLINSLLDSKKALDDNINSLNAKEQAIQELQKSTQESIAQLNAKKQEQEQSMAEFNAEKTKVYGVIEQNESELIRHSVDIINSSNPSLSELEQAKSNLEAIMPQLSIDSVKNQAQQAINNANGAINYAKQQEAEKAAQNSQAVQNSQPGNSGATGSGSTSNSGSASGNSSQGSPTTNYKKVLNMQATAYSGGTITAMGLPAVRNPNGISTIAVDPSVIPLGSKVYIPGYGYAIASDTGGAIKGNIIDLFMNSEQACLNWGRRPVTVYIIAYPGQW